MDFFNSLTLDLKVLVVGIVGCALLAIFSGNRNTEKRYLVVLALLAAAGAWRFTHVPGDRSDMNVASNPAPRFVKAQDQHVPLVSTSAK